MRWATWILFLGLGLGPCPASATESLNVFIWSEYLDPQVVKDFEKAFDARVVVDVYEDAEAMLAKLQSGGDALYDIVVPSDYLVPAMVALKLLAPLRHANIPNLENLDPRFRSPPFDPRNTHTAAYQWGTVGIYYRKVPGQDPPDSWAIFFDARRQPGPLVLIDSMRDAFGAALRYKGHSLNSADPMEIKDARDLLIDARNRAVAMEGSVGGRNRVLARTAAAAIVYSGEAARGIADDPETAYVIPREGSQIWLDNLAIPARAPHRDLAERFINFILEPGVGARISNFTQFASPNQPALALVRKEDRQNATIYPGPDALQRLEFLKDLGGKTRLLDRAWTQVKAR